MSYNAFVTILLGFNGGQKLHTDTLAEERKILRCHLMEKLHGAELKENGKTPSPKRKTPGTTQTSPMPYDNNACPGSTPVSSKENVSPIKYLLNSPLKVGKCSSELLEKERKSLEDYKSGRRWKSRPLTSRVRIQENTFSVMSRRIHRGSKDDFLAGLSCSVVCDDERTVTPESNEWNGKFSVQDIIKLTKMIHASEKEQTVYDILTKNHAAERHFISTREILQVEDNSSASDAMTYVRERVSWVNEQFICCGLSKEGPEERVWSSTEARAMSHRVENPTNSSPYLPEICLPMAAGH